MSRNRSILLVEILGIIAIGSTVLISRLRQFPHRNIERVIQLPHGCYVATWSGTKDVLLLCQDPKANNQYRQWRTLSPNGVTKLLMDSDGISQGLGENITPDVVSSYDGVWTLMPAIRYNYLMKSDGTVKIAIPHGAKPWRGEPGISTAWSTQMNKFYVFEPVGDKSIKFTLFQLSDKGTPQPLRSGKIACDYSSRFRGIQIDRIGRFVDISYDPHNMTVLEIDRSEPETTSNSLKFTKMTSPLPNWIGEMQDFSFSPQSNKIAIITSRVSGENFFDRAKAFCVGTKIIPIKTNFLWEMNIDGSNLKPVTQIPQIESIAQPQWQLNWLPDGKSVSFVTDGTVWKVRI